MKVRYIKSACVVVEHEGVKVLCDPWLTEGIYYGSWCHYPPLTFQPEDFHDMDYLYISHIHPDHLDPATLRRLPKRIPVVVANYVEKFVLKTIKDCGFETVIELDAGQQFRLGQDFHLEILGANFCDPAVCGKQFPCDPGAHATTTTIDTLAIFRGGGRTIVNTNDCPYTMAVHACEYVKKKYVSIDFLLTGYAGAGPYPQCYEMYEESQALQKAESKKHQFLDQCVQYVEKLRPGHFLPFAGQYTLGGRLHHLNRYRGVPELEELEELLVPKLRAKNLQSTMVLLNSGESFDLKHASASAPYQPINLDDKDAYIREILSKRTFTYESEPAVEADELVTLLKKAQEAMITRLERRRLKPEHSEWSVYFTIEDQHGLVRIPLDRVGIEITEGPVEGESYLRVSMDPRLLRMILERKAHWNNAEIGSHIRFERRPDVYERSLFYRLCFLHL